MATTITAVRSNALTNDVDGDGVADFGDTIRTTLVVTNTGAENATNVTVNDPNDGLTVTNIAPVAVGDFFTAVGNTVLRVGGAANIGTGPSSVVAGNVLSNDFDIGAGSNIFTLTAVSGGTSFQGGTFNLNADGSFNYVNQAGDTGTDFFTYTITDRGADGIAGNADDLSSTGRVTITLSGEVWYVDGAAAGGGTGTSANPFNSLASLNVTATDPDGVGDVIYVKGTVAGPLTLEASQQLIGTGVDLVVGGFTLATATANSTINNASTGITLATDNTIRGITINGTTGATVNLEDGNASVGNLVINQVSITGTGKAVDIDQGGTLNVVLQALSSASSTSEGLHLQGVTGSFSAATGTIQTSTGTGVLIGAAGGATASSGGDVNFTFGGDISSPGGSIVEIQDRTGGTITFSGAITEGAIGSGQTGILIDGSAGTINFNGQTFVSAGAGTTGNGVTLTNNTATINFAATGTGLDITTTSGTALTFTGGGTLNVTGAANSITTTTGQLINFGGAAPVTIGGSGVTFANLTGGTVANTALLFNNVDGGAFSGGAVSLTGTTGATSDGIRIEGGSTSSFTFGTVGVGNTGDEGLEINGATGAITMTSFTNGSAGGNNVEIVNNGATINLANGGTGTIAGSAAGSRAFFIDQGTGSLTYNGTVTKVTDGQTIRVEDKTGGTVSFGGAVTNQAAADGISLATNTGATIAFTGALDLNTSASNTTAFSATGGGTVTATGAASTVSSGTGTAVSVSGTTIGAAGMTFQSINTNDAAIGVNLQNTGTGGFTVTGTGAANSGGTILNATTGINLLNTGPLSLTQVNITGDVNSDDGIFGSGVTGLTLVNVDISGSTNSGSNFDRGVEMVNLTGVATITNSTFTNMPGHLFNVKNSSGTLNMIITGSTFSGSNGTFGDDGLLIEADGTSTIIARISTSTFDNNEGDHFQFATDGGASTSHITFSNNTLTTSNSAGILGGGITISPAGASDLTFSITGNTITGNVSGGAIDITTINSTSAMLTQGTISGNQVGNPAVANSGSAQASGISVENNGNGTLTALVTNNNVTQVGGAFGIEVFARSGTGAGGTINATVTNNTITNPGTPGALNGIRVTGGTSLDTDFGRINVDILNNTADTSLATDIRISSRAEVDIYFAGYVGANNDTAAIKAYLEGRNTGAEVASVAILGGTPLLSNIAAGSVALPASPILPLLAAQQSFVPADASSTVGAAADAPLAEDAPAGDQQPVEPADAVDAPAADQPTVIDDGVVSAGELALLVEAAIARWAAAGASDAQIAAMRAVTFDVASLGGLQLGVSQGTSVTLDDNAAGFNWFVDATPLDDSEFTGTGGQLYGLPDTVAGTRIDLLTAIMHELGHQIGLDDQYGAEDSDALMFGFVGMGERRLPEAGAAAAGGTLPVESAAFALAPVNLGTLTPGQAFTLTWTSTVDAMSNGVVPAYSSASTVTGGNFTAVTSNSVTLAIDTLALGSHVFVDVNRNNVFDGGDTGLVGVTMSLFVDADDNGVADGAAIATTTSIAGGAYAFTGLAPGTYIVSINAANFGAGQPLHNRASVPGGTDPDNNIDLDDNGVTGPGGTIISAPITIAYNSEPTAGTGNDTNNTVDFGFLVPNTAPTLAGLATSTTFTENVVAGILDADVTFADAEGNFNGSALYVSGLLVEDTVTIVHQGNGAGQVGVAGSVISFGGVVIGTMTDGMAGTNLIVVFNAAATSAAVVAVIQRIGYTNNSDAPTAARTLTIRVTDEQLLEVSAMITVNVTAVDDPPVAVADSATTPENATVNIAVTNNDTDVDGGTKNVVSINGTAVVANQTVTLASGATVKLEANGTLTYNPNGVFNTLVSAATGTATGATNTSAADAFGYALNGGSTTTVTVTVTGVDGAGDRLQGSAGNESITGTEGADYIDVSQGGSDTANGGGGNDVLYFGASFGAGDVANGGAGINDQLGLQGAYGAGTTLSGSQISNVEVIVAMPGFSYNLTTTDDLIAGGTTLTFYANELTAGQNFTLNGAAETDGSFLVIAGAGTDTITTGAGNDAIYFGPGRYDPVNDFVNGGAGSNDQFGLDSSFTGTLSGARIQNIEVIALLAGGIGGSATYNITLANDLTAAGQTLKVWAPNVNGVVTVNGAAETDGNLQIFGGKANDSLTGSSGADFIWGNLGADALTGGAGADTFYFSSALGAGNIDTIADFAAGSDQLQLDDLFFTGLPLGALAASAFSTSGAATTAAHRIIYNTATGALSYDADGVGGVAAVQFATLSSLPAITVADFLIS